MKHLHGVYVGHWAGNLGDSAVFDVFDQSLPDNVRFTLEVHSIGDWRRRPQTELVHWQDETTIEREMSACDGVVLLGTTVVTDLHDSEWPIAWIVKSLEVAKRFGKPTHAVGVGVYPTAKEAEGPRFRKLFVQCVDTFSVRDQASRQVLLSSGVPASRIILAADLAWLFDRSLNIAVAQSEMDPLANGENLIGVNVVHEDWEGEAGFYQSLAKELDEVYFDLGATTVFFCNEIREGHRFDKAAAVRTIDLMKSPAAIPPVRWMHPEEMIARLACCKVVVSMRYHFSIFATLAGVPWIGFSRGQKSYSLLSEFGKSTDFAMGAATNGRLSREILSVWRNWQKIADQQTQVSQKLKERAKLCQQHVRNILLCERPRFS